MPPARHDVVRAVSTAPAPASGRRPAEERQPSPPVPAVLRVPMVSRGPAPETARAVVARSAAVLDATARSSAGPGTGAMRNTRRQQSQGWQPPPRCADVCCEPACIPATPGSLRRWSRDPWIAKRRRASGDGRAAGSRRAGSMHYESSVRVPGELTYSAHLAVRDRLLVERSRKHLVPGSRAGRHEADANTTLVEAERLEIL